jgi:NADH-dependent peroxiredoxin subunit F
MYDLLIVGGGPAGVAAAAYGQQLGLETLLISPDLGGKINYGFSLRGLPEVETVHGASLVHTFAAKIAPGSHLTQTVSEIEEIEGGFSVKLTGGEAVEGRTLVLATGAKPRRLYVPGEDELWGRGLSYSAVSHAALFAGRTVAVVGNDRRAQIAVLELSRQAHTVMFIVPNPQGLDETLLQRINGSGNLQLFKGWEIVSVEGNDYVSGISLSNGRIIRKITLDGVFVELGLIPNSDFVAHLVERDAQGRVKVDHRAATSHPGIFAGGDLTNAHAEQVPVAIGEGIKAALSASEYLAGLDQA